MQIYRVMYGRTYVKTFAVEAEAKEYWEKNSWTSGYACIYTSDELLTNRWNGQSVRLGEANNFDGCGIRGELVKVDQFGTKFKVGDVEFSVDDVMEITDFGENDETDTVRIQLFR